LRNKTVLAVSFSLLCAAGAQAQASRTWVSGVGDDVNPCSRTAPCKTFPGAISKTAAGGEINAIDSAGFGAVTITKSMTIDGAGVLAGILNAGSPGIIVNAGVNDSVIIRNLDINGFLTGTRGISILQAKSVVIENVKIYGQGGTAPSGSGIYITPSQNVNVMIRNVTVTNNTGHGLYCAATGGSTKLNIIDSRFDQNVADGIDLVSNCKAAISGTSASFNGNTGVFIESATTDANVSRSNLNFNTFGISAGGGPIFLYSTDVSHNTFSINTYSGGTVQTHLNNGVINNGTNTLPSPNVGQQ
jgi:hypothetical protein